MKPSELIFQKFSYLSIIYANKLWNYQNISFEYEDVVQEFNIKIYTSIKAYGRRWSYYLKNGCNKPVPIKYYIECALSNKLKDLMKLITVNNNNVSFESINYDIGHYSDTIIDTAKSVYTLNGIDLVGNLRGQDKIIFVLFLKGYKKNEIAKLYKANVNIIEKQRKFLLENYGEDLLKNNYK